MRALSFLRSCSLALIAVVMLGGCSHTDLTNLWMDSQASSPPVDNILVIALDRDPIMRKSWEDALAAEFQAQGLLARQSYQVFPAELPDSQQVAVVMGRDNHDAALVAHRLTVVTNESRGGGYRDNAPAASGDYWRRGYTIAYTATKQLISYQEDEDARFQMDLARANGRLIWTGTTTPIDPTSPDKLRTEVAGQVVPELQRRKIIPKE
jgi:hypothetical protein